MEPVRVFQLVAAGVLVAVAAVLIAAGGWLGGLVLLAGAGALVRAVYRAY